MDETCLVGALGPLPLVVLRWPSDVLERLAKAGVSSIGQALRLPRAGFARRFGVGQLASLDRLIGRSPDLRTCYHARERFLARRGFMHEIEHHEAILAALAPLFGRLGKFLQARQSGITQLTCSLQHRQAPATLCVLKLAAPEASPQRLTALLGERLATLSLPEPARSCQLQSGDLVARERWAAALWQPGEQGGGGRDDCIEASTFLDLLRARLGSESIHGLELYASHRPEAASRRGELEPVAASAASRMQPVVERDADPDFRHPLWLLAQPQPLSEVGGLPRKRGPLRLLGEMERIETGWWESEEAARDYYRAVDRRGVHLWIFRERAEPHRWFLHGVFG
jgi:protein ImuB